MGQNRRYTSFQSFTQQISILISYLPQTDEKKSSSLLKATLQLVSNEDCSQRFKKAQIFAARKGINEGQLCAWDSEFKKDSCQGDSGDDALS